MSRIPDIDKSKYNKNHKFAWVDSQWEKFMMEQKKLKKEIKELKKENEILKKTYRGNEWRIEQFNRNRAPEDWVYTIEEMENKVKNLFNSGEEQ